MTANRFTALLLVLIQAAALQFLNPHPVFLATIAVAGVIGSVLRIRIPVSRRVGFWLCAGLAFVLLTKHVAQSSVESIDPTQPHLLLANTIAQYLLIVQLAQFFVRRGDDRMPQGMPALGLFTLVFASITSAWGWYSIAFQFLAIAFTLLSAVYLGGYYRSADAHSTSTGRTRPVVTVVLLLLIALTAWGGGTALKFFQNNVEAATMQWTRLLVARNTISFSGGGSLESVTEEKHLDGKHVALRVFSDENPGYLRGAVFDYYGGTEWEYVDTERTRWPARTLPAGIPAPPPGRWVFGIDNTAQGPWSRYDIHPDPSLGGFAFTPLGTTHLMTSTENVDLFFRHGVWQAFPSGDDRSYTAYVPATATIVPPREWQHRQLTQVPARIAEELQSLRQEVFAQARTRREKIDAVVQYLRQNYEYHVGIEVPEGQDPLLYFLLKRPPAHCEFFATAAAILLRMEGVPCRYVTGFLAPERDELHGCWLARNRDAHAWVEAYDETAGWVTVEATPAAGVPPAQPPPWLARFGKQLGDFSLVVRDMVQVNGVEWLVRSVVLISALGLLVFFLHSRRLWFRRVRAIRDPAFARLHKLLDRMDRRLQRRGITRQPGETLNQFAERVGTEYGHDADLCLDAQWYQLYASVRYGAEVTPEVIHWLVSAMKRGE